MLINCTKPSPGYGLCLGEVGVSSCPERLGFQVVPRWHSSMDWVDACPFQPDVEGFALCDSNGLTKQKKKKESEKP